MMFAQKDFEIDEVLRKPLMVHLATVELETMIKIVYQSIVAKNVSVFKTGRDLAS